MAASRILLALVLLSAVPGASLAAEPEEMPEEMVVSSSRPAQLPLKSETTADTQASEAAPAKPLTTQEQIDAWLSHPPKLDRSRRSDSDYAYDDETSGPRKVHGEAGVSIGTGGYRSGYVSSVFPIGENGTLGIAFSQTDFGENGGFYGYGYDPYDRYGYSGYGHGFGDGFGRRGGRSQSLAVSVDMADRSARRSAGTPDGCAPGFRDGERYVEPLWVSRMRADDDDCKAGDDR